MPGGLTPGAGVPRRPLLVRKMYFTFVLVVVVAWGATTLAQVILMPGESGLATLVKVSALGLGVALVAGYWMAQRVASPLADLLRVADAMRSGRYEERVAPTDLVELSSLGETLNVLGEEVSSRIAAMTRDRAQLRSMLSAMDEGIIAIDNGGCILFSNQAASRLLRSDLRTSRGQRVDSIPALQLLTGVVEEAKLTGGIASGEVKLGPRGAQTYISTKAQTFGLEGSDLGPGKTSSAGVVVVLHDMTSIRRLERVRRDFVANVSHELKTPLTAIRGYVEMLLGGAGEDAETSKRFLGKIEANVNRLSNLVQDILSLARIESTDETVGAGEAVRVDWRNVIQAVAAAHEDEALSKGISLSIAIPPEPLIVAAERESLRQILDNLVGNAIKYTHRDGQVWIEGHVAPSAGKMANCEIVVRDTGIGIPEKHLDRIFERFYRVDKARSREMGGTGLGLSIVKHLVASLGGEVGVESKVGEGSTFTVRMKMAAWQQQEEIP
ncbi:MAG: hypothetical protein RIQ81_1273 [Pseudomonadota bacterium]